MYKAFIKHEEVQDSLVQSLKQIYVYRVYRVVSLLIYPWPTVCTWSRHNDAAADWNRGTMGSDVRGVGSMGYEEGGVWNGNCQCVGQSWWHIVILSRGNLSGLFSTTYTREWRLFDDLSWLSIRTAACLFHCLLQISREKQEETDINKRVEGFTYFDYIFRKREALPPGPAL